MAQQKGLTSFLIRSQAGCALLAAVLSCGSPSDALANGKHHRHTSHHLPSWHAERDFGYGWGVGPYICRLLWGTYMGSPR